MEYIDQEFSKLKNDMGYKFGLKITSMAGDTKWLSINDSQLAAIKVILKI